MKKEEELELEIRRLTLRIQELEQIISSLVDEKDILEGKLLNISDIAYFN